MATAHENNTDVVDSTAVEVYTQAHAPTTLFRTDDPAEVIRRASEVADALKSVLIRQGLTTRIQGRDHVQVEGWTTCGAMLGVVPVVEWTRPLQNGWEARVVARTLDGRTIGGAEASCTRAETRWQSADDYAIRGMAQTRATSRALRGPLGFIVTLAGYAPTPAEEMTGIERIAPAAAQPPAPATSARSGARSERPASAKQKGAINARCAAGGLSADQQKALLQWIGATSTLDRLTTKLASKVIEALGEDGGGASGVLLEISTQASAGDERAAKIVERYGEAVRDA